MKNWRFEESDCKIVDQSGRDIAHFHHEDDAMNIINCITKYEQIIAAKDSEIAELKSTITTMDNKTKEFFSGLLRED